MVWAVHNIAVMFAAMIAVLIAFWSKGCQVGSKIKIVYKMDIKLKCIFKLDTKLLYAHKCVYINRYWINMY